MNPMARAQWQAAMAHRQRRGQELQVRRAQRKVMNNQVMLAVLKANDPLFEATYNRLARYIQRLPEKVQRVYLQAVYRTPGAFLDLYIHLRTSIENELNKHAFQAEQPDHPAPQPDTRARIRRAVAGRMAAPALESAGVLEERLGGAARSTELAELKARAKSGRAREGDLLRYLELSMNSGSGR
ncbi:MAG: hypothetical protein ACLGQW_11950 [Acidobacteriota bacterium]